MPATTYEGVVENGSIKLDSEVRLPEKTKVYVVVPEARLTQIASPRLVHPEDAPDFEKVVVPENSDAGL